MCRYHRNRFASLKARCGLKTLSCQPCEILVTLHLGPTAPSICLPRHVRVNERVVNRPQNKRWCRPAGRRDWWCGRARTRPLLCSAAEIISLPGWYGLCRDKTRWVLAVCDTSCVTPAGSCSGAPPPPAVTSTSTRVHSLINVGLSKFGDVLQV